MKSTDKAVGVQVLQIWFSATRKQTNKKNTLNNKNATEDKSSVMSEIHSSPLTPAHRGAGLRNHLVV